MSELMPEREAEIRETVAVYGARETNAHANGFACCTAHPVADAVPELLAEIDRLRAELARRTRDYAGVTAVRVRRRADGGWRVRYKRDGKNCSRPFDSRTVADEYAHSLRVEAAAKRAEARDA